MNINFSEETLNALSKVSPNDLQEYIEDAVRRQLVADNKLKPRKVSDYFNTGYVGSSYCSIEQSPF